MRTAIYIVIFARDSWWIDLDGEADGPFGTRDAAIQQAIAVASATARNGGRSEVRVTGPTGYQSDLVYQSADRSLLGRAVAMAHASA
jgi:hypothetical protein